MPGTKWACTLENVPAGTLLDENEKAPLASTPVMSDVLASSVPVGPPSRICNVPLGVPVPEAATTVPANVTSLPKSTASGAIEERLVVVATPGTASSVTDTLLIPNSSRLPEPEISAPLQRR